MILTGDWSGAEDALTAAAEIDGIDDVEEHSAARGALAALRGDVAAAQALAVLPRLRASDDPQDHAQCEALDALIAAAQGDAAGTLAHAREVMAVVSAIGLRSEFVLQSWPPGRPGRPDPRRRRRGRGAARHASMPTRSVT